MDHEILLLLWKGILIGVAINLGIGSIAWFCIRLTLERGFRHGRLASRGMTVTDIIYAILLLAGISQIHSLLLPIKQYLIIIAGLALIVIGYRHLKQTYDMSSVTKIELKKRSIRGDFLTVFLMTFFHPIAILSYLGVFSIITVPQQPHWRNYAIVVVGVTLGALAWWTPMIGFFAIVKKTLSPEITEKLTKIASCIMVLLGLYLMVDGLFLHLI